MFFYAFTIMCGAGTKRKGCDKITHIFVSMQQQQTVIILSISWHFIHPSHGRAATTNDSSAARKATVANFATVAKCIGIFHTL